MVEDEGEAGAETDQREEAELDESPFEGKIAPNQR